MHLSPAALGERAGLVVVEVEDRLALGADEIARTARAARPSTCGRALILSSTATRPVERDRAVAFVDLADEQLALADQGAGEGRIGVTKFFITAPFITVGSRWQAWRIQPIMPVTVDLPLVPPTATLRCAALNSSASNSGRVSARSAELVGARTTSGTVSSTAAEVTSDLLGAGRPAAVLREQLRCRRAQEVELVRRAALVERAVGARDACRRARGRSAPAAACRCRRCRRRKLENDHPAALLAAART